MFYLRVFSAMFIFFAVMSAFLSLWGWAAVWAGVGIFILLIPALNRYLAGRTTLTWIVRVTMAIFVIGGIIGMIHYG